MPKEQKKTGTVSKITKSRTKKTISFFSFKKTKQISSAKVTNAPQIDSSGLSHAAQHLLLLIQHAVDEHTVKVIPQSNWDALESINPSFLEKKKYIKDLCNIHHFSKKEKDTIAMRVFLHIEKHQAQNVLVATTSKRILLAV